MVNISQRNASFRDRLERELPDSLDRVIFVLFIVSLVLSLVKLLIAFPHYVGNLFVILLVTVAILFCFVLFYVLYRAPRHLILLTKWGLSWMTAYILLLIVFSPDRMNLVSIQHMFIVIMLAFYGLNRYWGIAFSGLFFLTVMGYMFGIQAGQFNMTMFPESFPFYSAFIIVLINFV